MKHVIILVSIFAVIGLWILPAFMIWHGFNNDWAWLYPIDALMTFALYNMIWDFYNK